MRLLVVRSAIVIIIAFVIGKLLVPSAYENVEKKYIAKRAKKLEAQLSNMDECIFGEQVADSNLSLKIIENWVSKPNFLSHLGTCIQRTRQQIRTSGKPFANYAHPTAKDLRKALHNTALHPYPEHPKKLRAFCGAMSLLRREYRAFRAAADLPVDNTIPNCTHRFGDVAAAGVWLPQPNPTALYYDTLQAIGSTLWRQRIEPISKTFPQPKSVAFLPKFQTIVETNTTANTSTDWETTIFPRIWRIAKPPSIASSGWGLAISPKTGQTHFVDIPFDPNKPYVYGRTLSRAVFSARKVLFGRTPTKKVAVVTNKEGQRVVYFSMGKPRQKSIPAQSIIGSNQTVVLDNGDIVTAKIEGAPKQSGDSQVKIQLIRQTDANPWSINIPIPRSPFRLESCTDNNRVWLVANNLVLLSNTGGRSWELLKNASTRRSDKTNGPLLIDRNATFVCQGPHFAILGPHSKQTLCNVGESCKPPVVFAPQMTSSWIRIDESGIEILGILPHNLGAVVFVDDGFWGIPKFRYLFSLSTDKKPAAWRLGNRLYLGGQDHTP